jgi:inorganic triphosphatase YgiF
MRSYKIETEAKFLIPDQASFAALQQLTQLGEFELKPAGVKKVNDLYLDTANRSLYQAGLACRLRTVKDKQIITLKTLTAAEGDLHRRREIESETTLSPAQVDTPYAWPDSPAKELVIQIIGSAKLHPLFTLHQSRHQFHVFRQGQPVIELSLDEVSLTEPEQADYRELEAELLESGTETDLVTFVLALQAQWSLQPERQSKFERGLAKVSPSHL